MTTWAAIRDGMKTRLATISGLSAHDVMPNTVADRNFAAVIYGEPLVTPGGHARKVDVNVRVLVRVQRGDPKDAQDALDAYVWPTGTNSIVAAVLAAPTLGGIVDDTSWISVDSIGPLVDEPTTWQANISFLCKTS